MEHLNNPDVYKPLNDDISNDLKQNIIRKLDLLFKNGLMFLNSITDTTYKSKVPLWVLKWHQLMQTSSWEN